MIDGYKFHVTCLKNVEKVMIDVRPSVIFSFIDPDTVLPANPSDHIKWHKYSFFDQEVGKHADMISSVVSRYVEDFRSSYEAGFTILFHCHAGVSRSPAACYLALAIVMGNAHSAFEAMLRICNKPWPNSRMVEDSASIIGIPTDITQPLSDYKSRHLTLLSSYRRLNSIRGRVSPVKRVEI